MYFSYFFDTSETIPPGLGFSHFDSLHLAIMLVIVLAIGMSAWSYRRLDSKSRSSMRLALAGLLAGLEICKTGILMATGAYGVGYLPLHLCSLNIFVILAHALSSRRKERGESLKIFLDNVLWLLCLPGAAFALAFPDWTMLPPENFLFICGFSEHAILAGYPFVCAAGGDLEIRPQALPHVLAALLAVAGAVTCFNRRFHTNFMFLMASPGQPLDWFADALGNYRLGFVCFLVLDIAVMYGLPAWLRRHKNKKAPSSDDR